MGHPVNVSRLALQLCLFLPGLVHISFGAAAEQYLTCHQADIGHSFLPGLYVFSFGAAAVLYPACHQGDPVVPGDVCWG